MYSKNWAISARRMMSSLKINEVSDISEINHNIYQRDIDMIYSVMPKEYNNYPSKQILKHADILFEVIK